MANMVDIDIIWQIYESCLKTNITMGASPVPPWILQWVIFSSEASIFGRQYCWSIAMSATAIAYALFLATSSDLSQVVIAFLMCIHTLQKCNIDMEHHHLQEANHRIFTGQWLLVRRRYHSYLCRSNSLESHQIPIPFTKSPKWNPPMKSHEQFLRIPENPYSIIL